MAADSRSGHYLCDVKGEVEMGKITKEAFIRLCDKRMINRNVPLNVRSLAIDIAYRHITKGQWGNGYPDEMYYADGLVAIRYQNGMVFHYDLIKGTWF